MASRGLELQDLTVQPTSYLFIKSLVTQPMLQCRPNPTELRLMDSYIQILCRFQKCKGKVPPPSLLSNEKSKSEKKILKKKINK